MSATSSIAKAQFAVNRLFHAGGTLHSEKAFSSKFLFNYKMTASLVDKEFLLRQNSIDLNLSYESIFCLKFMSGENFFDMKEYKIGFSTGLIQITDLDHL